ncbi:MAG TPA: HAMP domain-containing histidine kinase [Gammaproteobacteria bacterium]|nr:HAMP domain-containing histidine kinase [Gammaproteobacteria bacterium]
MLLRQKLFLVLSLMAIVPLLVLLFGVVNHIEHDLETRTSEELDISLIKMAGEINTLMNNQKSLVRGLSKVPVVRDFARMLQNKEFDNYEERATQLMAFFLNYQSTVPSIQALRFTDVNGITLVKVKEGHLIANKYKSKEGLPYVEDIAYKPFFILAKNADEEINVSDFERGKVLGEVDFCPAMVRYTAPIRDELEFSLGMLIVNMWGKRFDDAVEASLGAFPGKAYIVELNQDAKRDGIFLYHKDASQRFANQSGTDYRLSRLLTPEQWQSIKQAKDHGVVETKEERMFFYRKFSPFDDRDTKWLLVIDSNRDTILAPLGNLRNWITGLIVVGVILSLLIAQFVAVKLARPVHQLAQIITRFADGEKHSRYNDQRSDEIGLAGKAFNYLCDKLSRAQNERDKAEVAARQSDRLAAVGQMAAGIGHEINNPLMNIMSLASLIDESIPEKDTQSKEDVKALMNEGKRCARIVQGILNFARETEPRSEEFDMAELLDSTLAVFNHRLETSNIFLEKNIEHPLIMVGDAAQLQQVLINILINAMHESHMDSVIGVLARRDAQDKIHIEITDQGEGISKEDLARVFSPFFTTKPEGTGTGLGLSVSYGIINKHGGTITLENRQDDGLLVCIELPVLPGADSGESAQLRSMA